jgi:hypothetical protein
VPLHYCTKNWAGTLGAMEAHACLDMTVDLYENKMCTIDCICIDDDASTRSLMKWSNADWMINKNSATPPTSEISKGPNKGKMQVRPDRGKLPPNIPEPVFAADPNHRRKVFTGELYAMLSMKVKERCTLTTNDVLRLGKNYGYMIRGSNSVAGNEEAMMNKGKAVLEHHFDNHEFCGAWCPRLRMSEEERKASPRFYRNKEKDGKLYVALAEMVNRFIELDRLKEVAHKMDTQVNESFNNTVAWLAPKNKIYCGSRSLENRIGIAVGIKTLGLGPYIKRLYNVLGIEITPNIVHILDRNENKRAKRLTKIKTTDAKKVKLKRKFQKQADAEVQAKVDRSKRDGTYKSGQNMQGEEEQIVRPAKKNRKDLKCSHCGKMGHTTKRSSQCDKFTGATAGRRKQATVATAPTAATTTAPDAAEDMDRFDSLPLNEQEGSDDEVEDVTLTNLLNPARDEALCDSDGEDLYSGPTRSSI